MTADELLAHRPKASYIRLDGDVAYVSLSKGLEAIVDAGDVPIVSGINWFASECRGKTYAIRNTSKTGDSQRAKSMHRLLLCPENSMQVDHINGNGLDNRRCNLRIATHAQNQWNVGRPKTNTSGIKGVRYDKARGKWRASIWVNGKRKHVGCFANIDDAAMAYANAVITAHGEFGRTA